MMIVQRPIPCLIGCVAGCGWARETTAACGLGEGLGFGFAATVAAGATFTPERLGATAAAGSFLAISASRSIVLPTEESKF